MHCEKAIHVCVYVLAAAEKAFDRETAATAQTWFADPVPATGPGPSAVYSVTVKMTRKESVEGVYYYNWGAASPISSMLDAQWLKAYYSEDGVTWEDKDIGHTFPLITTGLGVQQEYRFQISVSANFWKFEMKKTKYLDKGLAVPEIDFILHVSSPFHARLPIYACLSMPTGTRGATVLCRKISDIRTKALNLAHFNMHWIRTRA